jgi:peptidoglycan/LPS O-acetylase OafA/YrhL
LLSASIVASHVYDVGYRNVIGFAIDPLLIAVLIVQLVANRGLTATILNSKPMVFLGTISYSTYLYQQIVLWPTGEALSALGAPRAVSFVGCVVAVWLVASLSYALVERPFLRLRRRLAGGSQPPGSFRLHEATAAPTVGVP